jgi:alpha-D-xyloside xylohydrolase
MTDELGSMGIKLMVSVWSQINHDSGNYEEMRERNLLVKSDFGPDIHFTFWGNSTFFDATNPEAREFVWQKCKKNYFDKGVELFWLDEAEPEYDTYDFENHRYHIGPSIQTGNLYPQLYSRGFFEGMKAGGRDEIVNLVRCAWAGSQRYGALVWSGDVQSTFEALRRQICAGLHMGISGIPWWTTDIGGFHGGHPDDGSFRELLVRWFQFGTFCPVMRLHGFRTPKGKKALEDYMAHLTGVDNEVWSFGEEVYAILEKYLKLREKLRPVTRELMREAHEKGSPVIRPMFYEFPDDPVCWDCRDQYMFGADILVAPVVTEGAVSRDVYLPEGAVWTNMHDGTAYEGGRTVCAGAPPDVIPVFLRDGNRPDLVGEI